MFEKCIMNSKVFKSLVASAKTTVTCMSDSLERAHRDIADLLSEREYAKREIEHLNRALQLASSDVERLRDLATRQNEALESVIPLVEAELSRQLDGLTGKGGRCGCKGKDKNQARKPRKVHKKG